MAGLFGGVADGSYKGLYPGADPYDKAEMIRQKIPSAQQEALQEPTIDPIKAASIAATGGGVVMSPGGAMSEAADSTGKYLLNGLFTYILNQSMQKVRNTTIDKFTEAK